MSEAAENSFSDEQELWPRYFLKMAYDGTAYHGWQRQPNGTTVQEVMEAALRKILRQDKVITTGCGRTDSGVHASDFYLHFHAFKTIENTADVLFKLNQLLPWDIAVYELQRVHPKAHARFDATERSYEYHIHQVRDPFHHRFSTYYPWPLNVDAMNEAAQKLIKQGDFACFCKSGGGQKTTICDVRKAYWEKKDSKLVFYITADRFLRNMVRAIVGSLVDVGKGKLSLAEFEEVLNSGNRSMAGESVKASGLTLTKVLYPTFTLKEFKDDI
jgi:tRNA pseudouridine38-40 synthase